MFTNRTLHISDVYLAYTDACIETLCMCVMQATERTLKHTVRNLIVS